jgi:hypothetical protein
MRDWVLDWHCGRIDRKLHKKRKKNDKNDKNVTQDFGKSGQ